MQTGPNNTTTHSSNLDPISITSFDFSTAESNQFNPSEPNQSTVPFPSFISSTSVQQYQPQEPLQLTLQLPQQPLNQIANITAQRSLFNTSQNELLVKNVEPLIISKSNSKASKQQGYSTNSQPSHKSNSFSDIESRIALSSQYHSLTAAPLSSSPSSISKNIHDSLPISNESHPLLTTFQVGNNSQKVNRKTSNNTIEIQNNSPVININSNANGGKVINLDNMSPYKENSKNRSYKSFKFDWLISFNWLFYHDRVMYCLYCLKAMKSNIFTEGTTQFKKDSLSRHHCSSAHRKATEEFNMAKHDELSPEERFTHTKFQMPLPTTDGQSHRTTTQYIQSLPFKPMPRPKSSDRISFKEECIPLDQNMPELIESHTHTLSLPNQPISNLSKAADPFFKSNDISSSSTLTTPNHSSRQLSEMNTGMRNQSANSGNNQNSPSWSDFLVMNATFIAKHNLPLNLYEPLTNHILNMIDTFGYRKDGFDPPEGSQQPSNYRQ
jgi:hypothetical protein